MSAGRALINSRDLLESMGILRGQTVADFGCGATGHLAFPASWMVGEDGQVYAIDVNKATLAQMAGHAPYARAFNVTPTWGDVELLGGSGLEDDSIDHAVCMNNLWCMNDYETMLSEMRRVLRPDGSGYLIDWNKQSRHPAAPNYSDRAHLRDVKWFLDQLNVEHDEIYVGPQHWGLRLNFS
jgi:ubiquinone/menaquinone biosynthesis C-methylase UbiE